MTRRTTHYYNMDDPQPRGSPANQPPPVTYHAQAGVVVAGLVFASVLALLVGMDSAGLMRVSTIAQLKTAGVLSILFGAAFGVYWTIRSTTHEWRVDWIERVKRYEKDVEIHTESESERERQNENETPFPNSPTGADLDRVARYIMERQYIDQLPATRDDCTSAGVCDQTTWNEINRVMQEIGIKGARSWTAPGFSEALITWRSRTRLVNGDMFYKKDDGQWKRL